MVKTFSKEDKRLIKRAFSYMRNYKGTFTIFLILSISVIIIGILSPLILGKIIQSITDKSYQEISKYIIELLIVCIIQVLVISLKNYLNSYINNGIITDLKCDMYNKILNIQMKHFDNTKLGEFASRLEGDASTLSTIITNQFISTIIDVTRVLILGVAIFKIDYILALVVISSFPLSFVIFKFFGIKLRKENQRLKDINDNYYSLIYESLFGMKYIKTYGLKSQSSANFYKVSDELKHENVKISFLSCVQQFFSQLLNGGYEVLIIALGIYFIFISRIDIALFIAFSSYARQFSDSLITITSLNSTIQQGLVSLERIFQIIDCQSFSYEIFGHKELKEIEGHIEFVDITYGYEKDKKIFNKFNMNLEKNKVTVIVGKNGCGKSTLFSLILRLYEPENGQILIDGTDIATINEKSLRDSISIVHQQPFLFNLSIKDNFLLVCPNITLQEIKKACSMVYIDDYIDSLPQGYDSIIHENGCNLSGGQKQRIILAICIAKKSKILLLDEATAAVDSESQYIINKSIRNISKNKTVVIITHNIFTIANGDKVIVMNDGKIEAQGDHETLLRTNNGYRELYESELYTFENLEDSKMRSVNE